MNQGELLYQNAARYHAQHRDFAEDLQYWLRVAAGVQHLDGPVLELGCGTGRVTRALAAAGFDVVGLDNSTAMLDFARRYVTAAVPPAAGSRFGQIRFEEAPMQSFRIDQRFSAVICPFNSLAHLTDPNAVVDCLRAAYDHLLPGGVLAIAVFRAQPADVARDPDAVFEMPAFECDGRRIEAYESYSFDVLNSLTHHRWWYIDADTTEALRFSLRVFASGELVALLRAVGFVDARCEGGYDAQPATDDSPWLVISAHRPPVVDARAGGGPVPAGPAVGDPGSHGVPAARSPIMDSAQTAASPDRAWTDTYRVESDDAGFDHRLRVTALFRMMQETAWNHAKALGWGYEDTDTRGVMWALNRSRLRFVGERPVWQAPIRVQTWPTGIQSGYAGRDFRFLDAEGRPFAEAGSYWLLIDRLQRRPVSPKQHIGGDWVPAFGPLFDGPIERLRGNPACNDHAENHGVGYQDVDVHDHVNNVAYLRWIINQVPRELFESYSIADLLVAYPSEMRWGEVARIGWCYDRRSTPADDTVAAAACADATVAADGGEQPLPTATYHQVVEAVDNRVVCVARIDWTRRSAGRPTACGSV